MFARVVRVAPGYGDHQAAGAHHPHLTDVFDRLADEHRTVVRIQGEPAETASRLDAHLDYGPGRS